MTLDVEIKLHNGHHKSLAWKMETLDASLIIPKVVIYWYQQ